MLLVKLMEYFVGDIGAEVMFQKITDTIMLIFAPVIIFQPIPYTFYWAGLLTKESFLLHHVPQIFYRQIYPEGWHHYFLELINLIPPLFLMIPPQIFYI